MTLTLSTLLIALVPALLPAAEKPVMPLIPAYKQMHTLVASTNFTEKKYLAFPILLPLSETDILVGYKRGDSHALGKEANFELRHLNPATGATAPQPITLRYPNVNFQDGEFARFANGDIACYIDVQAGIVEDKKQKVERLGLVEFRSADGGKTFNDLGKVGVIDGIEYGYAFEAITEKNTSWMLAMTFSNLTGGKAIGVGNPAAGSVNVIRTDDNGNHWRFVKNLSHEFGDLPINESTFMRHGDGFIVSTRGYTPHQWLHITDGDFNVKRTVDLTATYPYIRTFIGRPRVFAHDNQCYLIGRNYTGTGTTPPASGKEPLGPMKLSLFRFDPATLEINKHVILDNAEAAAVADGYYAVPYWQKRDGKEYFNVITYKRAPDKAPDILRLEFAWGEVK